MEMNLFRDICEPPKGCGSHPGEQNPPCHLLTGLLKQRGQAELLAGDTVRGRGEKSHVDIPSVQAKPHQGEPRQGAGTCPCPSRMGTPLLPSLLPPPAEATRPLLCQLLFFPQTAHFEPFLCSCKYLRLSPLVLSLEFAFIMFSVDPQQ